MNIGKIIAAIFGLVCVFLIFYLMSSSAPTTKVDDTQKTEIKKPDLEKNSEDKLKKAEEKHEKQMQTLEKEKQNIEKQEKFAGLSTKYRVSCAPCHGLDGNGEIAPKISGKSQDEILKMLNDFNTHKSKNTLMSGLLKNVNSKDLEDLAKEISNFK